MTDYSIRAAASTDLPELLRITLVAFGAPELAGRVSDTDEHAFHRHALETGDVRVAELPDGRIAGYATTITRNSVRILSQLFVRPELQSAGLGRALFDAIEAPEVDARGLCATSDWRAISLYIQRGYIPAWPLYTVSMQRGSRPLEAVTHLDVVEAEVDDDFLSWDSDVSGRYRPKDHAYWRAGCGGKPYWFIRDGGRVGYGWIQDWQQSWRARWSGDRQPVAIGPLGARSPVDARDCLLAAVLAGFDLGERLHIEIAGRHPALPDLLRAGGRIEDAETAMFTDFERFGSPCCYLPAGGLLY